MISNEGVRLGAEAARRLARSGLYEFEPGPTLAEFTRIEREYGFEFAVDENWSPRATAPFWRDLL
ncbi:hypothetical protein ACFV1A_06560 [Streptomyces seoulensis]|uniref:Uncharacterized protein n=1 Tax=Streptomyces seoulensis TaxID=73044 RepID=A0A4P6TVB2_STRSO|nr:hypothetical protein [Streptomyces seoulensis]QBJ91515.1 hypothetical protein D0Z67_15295 [Streptomyces seoulensis]